MAIQRSEKIYHLLESAYRDFHSQVRRSQDPVSLVYLYSDPKDREVVAFFSALLAYGNVTTIRNSIREVLSALGPSPHTTLATRNEFNLWPEFRHRFTTGEDIEIVAALLSQALKSHGSLERFFVGTNSPDSEMRDLLSDFVKRFFAQPLPTHLQKTKRHRERNLKYLISDPDRGSACKRLNLFLRWMVRESDGIDLGLWKEIPAERLMLPVDTHLLQTLQALRWTKSKQATWRVVEEATRRLRIYSPKDPIRYDFALCHLSMSGENIRRYEGN